MTRRFKLNERVELTPRARAMFPRSVPTGTVVGVGGMLMRIQHDDGEAPRTWAMRHWQVETTEVKQA